jgi:DNA primase
VLCFDSDEAGQNAAVRSLDHLLASGLAVRVAVVPSPHDPDSFIKTSGGAAFKQLIERAEGFFDYYLNRLCATNDVATDKGRLTVLRSMAEAVHKAGNAVLTDKYAQKTALRLGVSPDAVRAEFAKRPRAKTATNEPREEQGEPPPAIEPPSAQEHWLVKLLLLHEDLLDWAVAHLDSSWIQNSLAREIAARRLAAHKGRTWNSLAAFLDECGTPEARNLVAEVTVQERPLPNPVQQLADVVLRLRNQFIERQMTAVVQRASHPDTSETDRLDLLRQQQELRQLKRQPLGPL